MTTRREEAALRRSLLNGVRQGVRWGVFAGLSQQVASVVTTVVLVRLLTPSEFGLVVAANIAVAMAALFTYLGIRLAIVRVPELDERTLWTLFWMSTGLGAVASGTVVALAGPLAGVLGEPDATPFLRVLGALLLAQTLSGVPRALLQREMRFRAVYGVEVTSVVAQAAAAVSAALSGLGAWSLVVGYAVHTLVLLVGYWSIVRRAPRLVFDARCAREQWRFGAGMWNSTLLVYVVRNVDFWAVSRALGSSTLGVYYVAYVLPNVLRQRLTWVTNEVLLPSFASLQEDSARLASIFLRSLRLHASVGLAAMAGVAVLSPQLVDVFFGSGWTAAITPMALVALAAGIEFLTQPAVNLLVALGRTGTVVTIQAGRALVVVPGSFLAAYHGTLTTVAAVVLGSSLVTALHAQLATSRVLGMRTASLFHAALPGLLASALMTGAVAGLDRALAPDAAPAVVELAALTAVGMAVYPGFLYALAPRFTRALFGDLKLLVSRQRGRP